METNATRQSMMDQNGPFIPDPNAIAIANLADDWLQNQRVSDHEDKNSGGNNNNNGNNNHVNTMSSNRPRSLSEPFKLLESDYGQSMAVGNNHIYPMNSSSGGDNGHIDNGIIGTTIKAPLPSYEPLPAYCQAQRGRSNLGRVPRRKPRRSNSSDAIMMLRKVDPPLFGGGAGFSNSNSEASAAANACSAHADLFELDGGIMNMGFGAGAGVGTIDPTSIDAMDSQKANLMRVLLLGEGFGGAETNNFPDVCSQQRPQDHMEQQRHCRRNTIDDPFSLVEDMLGDDTNPTDQLQTDLKNAISNPDIMFPSGKPLKRRKSEPLINSDFWEDTAMNNILNGQPQITNNVDMPINTNNVIVKNQDNAQANINMMASSLINAREAFESINRLKEKMNGPSMGLMPDLANASQFTTPPGLCGATRSVGGTQQQPNPHQMQVQQMRQLQGIPMQCNNSFPNMVAQQGHPRNQYVPGCTSAGVHMSALSSGSTMGQQQGQSLRGGQHQVHQHNKRHLGDQQQIQMQIQIQQQQLQKLIAQVNYVPDKSMQQRNSSNQCISSAGSLPSVHSSFAMNQADTSFPQFSSKGMNQTPKSLSVTTHTKSTPVVVPNIPLPSKSDPEILKLNQGQVMVKLQTAMDRTKDTQKKLQEWDRANGLPKSHSQTMVNSSRSRKQLTDGTILKKWNGAPLLNFAKEGQGATMSMLNRS